MILLTLHATKRDHVGPPSHLRRRRRFLRQRMQVRSRRDVAGSPCPMLYQSVGQPAETILARLLYADHLKAKVNINKELFLQQELKPAVLWKLKNGEKSLRLRVPANGSTRMLLPLCCVIWVSILQRTISVTRQ